MSTIRSRDRRLYNKDLAPTDKKKKNWVTLTAVRPPARFGGIKINGQKVKYFKEKSKLDEGWINGGFFVIEPEFLNTIKGDKTFLEKDPLEKAAKKKQLVAYKHTGFWQCMDTKRDKEILDKSINFIKKQLLLKYLIRQKVKLMVLLVQLVLVVPLQVYL